MNAVRRPASVSRFLSGLELVTVLTDGLKVGPVLCSTEILGLYVVNLCRRSDPAGLVTGNAYIAISLKDQLPGLPPLVPVTAFMVAPAIVMPCSHS